jgi:hypothetical protein
MGTSKSYSWYRGRRLRKVGQLPHRETRERANQLSGQDQWLSAESESLRACDGYLAVVFLQLSS